MVNQVVNSISTALHAKFGDSHRYYVENIEQNIVEPCFTIGVLNPLVRSVNSIDYYRTVPCVLHYFSDNNKDTIVDCWSVGEEVLECLEYLPIDGELVRAEDMSYTMVDEVLQVFLTYRFWTKRVVEEETKMSDVVVENTSHPQN